MDFSRSSFCWFMNWKRVLSSSYSPMAARLTSPIRSSRPRRSSISANRSSVGAMVSAPCEPEILYIGIISFADVVGEMLAAEVFSRPTPPGADFFLPGRLRPRAAALLWILRFPTGSWRSLYGWCRCVCSRSSNSCRLRFPDSRTRADSARASSIWLRRRVISAI